MYTLHIGNKNYSSWSLRPWILMRELGLPFDEKITPFHVPGFPAFSTFSPSAKVPCLHDDGTVVWDSLAIAEYLAEKHPGVWPQDAKARAWARCAAAEMHSGFQDLRNTCGMNVGLRIELPSISPGVQANLDRIAALWTEGLQRFGGPFLAGPTFTAVDAFFCPVAFRVQTYDLKLPKPALDYVQRILALEGMKAWYAAGLKEPWRDGPHEDDVRRSGKVLEDLRAV